MTVNIGEVTTFPHPKANKKQVKKMFEECAEVFEALNQYKLDRAIAIEEVDEGSSPFVNVAAVHISRNKLIAECADVIQATANLLAAIDVDDMRGAMADCAERNRARGRL